MVGAVPEALVGCWATYRRGEAGRCVRVRLLFVGIPNIGEMLRSEGIIGDSRGDVGGISPMFASARWGIPGKISSTGFLGVRTRLGEPAGLAGRWIGDICR